jgi:hypothetical protein
VTKSGHWRNSESEGHRGLWIDSSDKIQDV